MTRNLTGRTAPHPTMRDRIVGAVLVGAGVALLLWLVLLASGKWA